MYFLKDCDYSITNLYLHIIYKLTTFIIKSTIKNDYITFYDYVYI